jgi:hypothetical protein
MVGLNKVIPRGLTTNEVLVLRNLLARTDEPETNRIRSLRIPRSTYLEIKQRVYSIGLLEDRYVPSPLVLGYQGVSFLLTRPFAESRESTAEALCSFPGSVLVWSGIQTVLGVVFHRTVDEMARFRSSVEGGDSFGRGLIHLEIPSDQPLVPVYFDFEGAWSHFAGAEGVLRYPRALPYAKNSRGHGISNKTLIDLWSLIHRPFGDEASHRKSHLIGPATLPRSQRRLLANGYVEWRTFLSVQRIPDYAGRDISDVVFLTGQVRREDGLYALFRDLAETCGVFPFLLASDGNSVIVGLLAARRGSTGRESTASNPRAAVFPIVSNHLTGMEVIREPISLLKVHRSHRYDCLAPLAE